jgi:tetratricopeptide (TPR) repeat protein
MQLKIYLGCFLLLLCVMGASPLLGQDKISESEVQVQKAFIEGKKQYLLGNLDKALEIYEELWRDHADISSLAFEIARLYVEKEELSKGLEYAQKAISLEPTNLWFLKFQADAFEKMGQNGDAAQIYEQIAAITPDEEEVYDKWAFLLTKGGRIDEAIEVYDQAEKLFGINENIIRQKYTLYLGSGKEKKAEKELMRLVDAYPRETLYLEMLAGFYEQINRQEEAAEVFQKIIKLDPGNTKAQLALAGQSAAQSDEVRFLESLSEVFQNEEVQIGMKIERIQPLINKALAEKDRPVAEKILELSTLLEASHSSKAEAYFLSARMLDLLGRRQEAESKYQQALDLDDTQFDYWEALMQLQWSERRFEALSYSSMDAMDVFPNQPICYYYHGRSLSAMEDGNGALSVLDQALLMSESNKPLLQKIYLAVAEAWEVNEDTQQALNAYQEALKVDRENGSVLSSYAYFLARTEQKLEEALSLAEKAVKINAQDATAQQSLAWVLYKKGDYKKAQQAMEKAMEQGLSKDPLALEQFGDILFQLGDREQALEFWNKAKVNGNTSKILDKKISEKRLY